MSKEERGARRSDGKPLLHFSAAITAHEKTTDLIESALDLDFSHFSLLFTRSCFTGS
ncbi:hypothetical protein [Stenotrophomonas acidaminiphila]|uniref:hypothetical protein n=1 Tax=Stenotrophomonas acidaminiphila TaxID=128780 RepID=UPI0028AE3D97|nr:hypothetical protein [Stenotrophomonas acidaminiphila]